MANAYLITLSSELEYNLICLRNLKTELNDFLLDIPHVEGLNGIYPIPSIHKTIISLDELSKQIETINKFVKEALKNG